MEKGIEIGIEIGDLFKSLKIPDKILTAVLIGAAVGEEILDSLPSKRSVTRSLYTTQPEFNGIRKHSFRMALIRLLESKYLEKIETDAKTRYQLTADGLDRLYKKFPILKLQNKKFDGLFRVVVYDISETERKLRREMRQGLKKLGFAYLQQSVWISPHDWEDELEEIFKKLKVEDKVFVFKSSLSPERSDRLLKTYWPDLTRT